MDFLHFCIVYRNAHTCVCLNNVIQRHILYQLCKKRITAVFKPLHNVLCAMSVKVMTFDLLIVFCGIDAVASICFGHQSIITECFQSRSSGCYFLCGAGSGFIKRFANQTAVRQFADIAVIIQNIDTGFADAHQNLSCLIVVSDCRSVFAAKSIVYRLVGFMIQCGVNCRFSVRRCTKNQTIVLQFFNVFGNQRICHLTAVIANHISHI